MTEVNTGEARTRRCAISPDPNAAASPLRRKKYAAVSPGAFGINRGKKRIVVIRAGGPILGGGGAPSGGQIKADAVIKQMRAVEKDKVHFPRPVMLCGTCKDDAA
jgi:ClpP class serine protease